MKIIRCSFYLVLLMLIIFSGLLLYQKHRYFLPAVARIDPLPRVRSLIAQKQYADAAEYLDYFISFDYVGKNPEAASLRESLRKKRESLEYQSGKILEGILTGHSDETAGQISAVASDFCIVGDLRDLFLQSSNWLHGREVDTLLLTLSATGLIASAATAVTACTSEGAKAGISIMKLAQRSGKLPKWISKTLIREIKIINKTRSLKSVEPLLENLHTVYRYNGIDGTLKLISRSRNAADLKKLAHLSKRFKKDTAVLMELSGDYLLKNSSKLERCSDRSVKLASTYGEKGLMALEKSGEKSFLKAIERVKKIKGILKSVHGGELLKIFLRLAEKLSERLLVLTIIISSALLFTLAFSQKTAKRKTG